MVSPLSLSNVLTVIVALACLRTIAPQVRGGVVRLWRLALPVCFAAVQALVLLAGIFNETIHHDAEWIAAAAVGALLGRMRGWASPIEVDRTRQLVRLKPSVEPQMAAIFLVILAAIDFASASLEAPVLPADYVAAGAAFCAAFIGFRALAIAVRATRAPHVELHGGWPITPSSSTPAESGLPRS